VIAATNDFKQTFKMAKLYSEVYKNNPKIEVMVVNISNNLPYTQFGREGFGAENIFGKTKTLAYKRVFYIIDTHGVSGPNGLELQLSKSSNVSLGQNSLFLRHLFEHTPNAKSRDLAILSCHAGAFDTSLFPGNVFGASPSDGLTWEEDATDFIDEIEAGEFPPPLTATNFFKFWTFSLLNHDHGEMGYAPPWLVSVSSSGKRKVQGTETMGSRNTPVFNAHRNYVLNSDMLRTSFKCAQTLLTVTE
jgi:hypothetical protein